MQNGSAFFVCQFLWWELIWEDWQRKFKTQKWPNCSISYIDLQLCFENSFRWFINKEGGNSGSLKNVRTSSILPVDLNALIYMDYMAISEFFSLLGDSAKSEEFSQKAAKLQVYFLQLMHYPSTDFLRNIQSYFRKPFRLFCLWLKTQCGMTMIWKMTSLESISIPPTCFHYGQNAMTSRFFINGYWQLYGCGLICGTSLL